MGDAGKLKTQKGYPFFMLWYMLVVLGDEEPEHPGIALMKEDFFLGIAQLFKTALNMADTPDGKEKK